MLKQASVDDIKGGKVKRDNSYLVITMRFYPRFLRKELRDEFISDLAPNKVLLSEFNAAQKRLGSHNSSFAEVDYEQRFQLSQSGLAQLKRLAELSREKDIYLICICKVGERCHREILLLAARELFACEIGDVFHSYPIFMQRLSNQTASL